jgi:serine/threonine protein kinase/WD40 repeat protein/tetratricopeptide (TPR) repeat protein
MADSSGDRNPVEELAEEFAQRYRRGERPSLTEYVSKYPHLAEQIRDLFPALVLIEDLKPAGADATGGCEAVAVEAGRKLEQLGDYRILREVGRGGMGVVYEAEQVSLGRHVALKVLPTKALLDTKQKRRFEREAKAAAKLHHTNIVPVYGVGEHDGLPYYGMQFIQGLGLDAVIAELRRQRAAGAAGEPATGSEARSSGQDVSAVAMARSLMTGRFVLAAPAAEEGSPGPATVKMAPGQEQPHAVQVVDTVPPSSSSVVLPGQAEQDLASGSRRPTYWQSVARIGVQVADALEHAHRQGVLHRDVKPSNLLLDMQGTVWVTDFGLAKASDQENLTHTGDVLGTLRYMPPEAFDGRADACSDVYSLGLTLYELLALRPAFDEADPNKLLRQVSTAEPVRLGRLDPYIPHDLVTVVHKAIERNAAHRYASAGELRADLQRFLNGEPIQARRVGELERLWKWARRHPAVAGLLLAVVVSLLAGAGVSTYFAFLAGERARQAVGERDKAEKSAAQAVAEAERAQNAEHKAVASEDTVRRQLAELTLQSGQAHAQSGEVARGLFTMLDAWRQAPADADDLRRAIRLNLAAWSRQLPVLHQAFRLPNASGMWWDDPQGKTFFSRVGGELRRFDAATLRAVGPPLPLPAEAELADFRSDPPVMLLSQGNTFWTQDALTGRKLGQAVPLGFAPNAGVVLGSPPRFAVAVKLLRTRSESDPPAVPVILDFHRGRTITPDVKLGWLDSMGLLRTRDGEPVLVVYRRSSAGSEDTSPQATFWDLATGKPLTELLWPRMSSDPRLCWDGRAVLAVQARRLSVQGGDLQRGVVFPLGHRDVAVRSLEADTGRPRGEPWQPRRLGSDAHLTGDGRTLFVGCVDNRLRLYDLALGLQRGGDVPGHGALDEWFTVYPDGATVALADARGLLRVWQTRECLLQNTAAANPRPLPAAGRLSRPEFNAVAHHPATARAVLLHSSEYGRLTRWTSEQPLGQALRRDLAYATFSPDGQSLATASEPSDSEQRTLVRLWDAQTGRLRVPPLHCPRFIRGLAFSPDSRTLAVACNAMTLLVDAATGRPLHTLPEASVARQVAFSADGSMLAVAYQGGWPGVGAGLRLWQVASGKPAGDFCSFAAREGNPRQVVFAAEGRRVVVLWNATSVPGPAIPGSSTLQVYDAQTGKPLGEPVPLGMEQGVAVCSPDGRWVAAADISGLVQQWDTAAGQRRGPPLPQADVIEALAYSPDGRWLAVVGRDQGVRLWDAATCRPVGPPLVHRAPVIGLTFSPDSKALVTTTRAGLTRTWSLPEPVADNREEVEQWLRATGGVKLEGSDVVLLDEAAWKKDAAAAHPVLAGVPLGDGRSWQDRLAREAEEDGDPRAALWHLDRLVAEHPDDWHLYARRGWLFGRLGEMDRAAKEYARAEGAGAGEELLDEHRHRATVCRLLGQLPAALWYLDRVVAARPADWRGYADRAEVHAALKKLPARAADLAKAIELGADADVLVSAAEERARDKDWRGAAELLGRAVAGGNREPDVLARLALCRLQAGDQAGYRRLCEAQRKELPALWPDLNTHVAEILCPLYILGRDALADWGPLLVQVEGIVRRAAAQDAALHAAWLRVYGCVLYRAGRFADATARLQEGLALNNAGAVEERTFLAMAQHRLGKAKEAQRIWDKLRDEPPAGDFWSQVERQVLHKEAQELIDRK